MDQAVYWLWFAGLFGRGTRLSHEMLEFYGSAKAVFEASEQELPSRPPCSPGNGSPGCCAMTPMRPSASMTRL